MSLGTEDLQPIIHMSPSNEHVVLTWYDHSVDPEWIASFALRLVLPISLSYASVVFYRC
jgi:hypothetical protein